VLHDFVEHVVLGVMFHGSTQCLQSLGPVEHACISLNFFREFVCRSNSDHIDFINAFLFLLGKEISVHRWAHSHVVSGNVEIVVYDTWLEVQRLGAGSEDHVLEFHVVIALIFGTPFVEEAWRSVVDVPCSDKSIFGSNLVNGEVVWDPIKFVVDSLGVFQFDHGVLDMNDDFVTKVERNDGSDNQAVPLKTHCLVLFLLQGI
jgi:hypothetical protein